jgi:hypothetical protein
MNPDVFITVAFTSFVVLLAIPALVVMVRMMRRRRRTDASSGLGASARGQTPCPVVIVRGTAASNPRKGVS